MQSIDQTACQPVNVISGYNFSLRSIIYIKDIHRPIISCGQAGGNNIHIIFMETAGNLMQKAEIIRSIDFNNRI
jgi:hypothetical protein